MKCNFTMTQGHSNNINGANRLIIRIKCAKPDFLFASKMIRANFRFFTVIIHLIPVMLKSSLIFSLILLISGQLAAQLVTPESERIGQLNLQGGLPPKLLSTRTAGFYHHTISDKELAEVQLAFQRAGIDAIIYFELDKPFASKDVSKAFSDYLTKREITNLVFIEKSDDGYRITITPFSGKEDMMSPGQSAWSTSNRLLTEALRTLGRTTSSGQKKENLLINDAPETDAVINPILGKRNEFYATDLTVDLLAVPKTGDEAIDRELEEIFKNNYTLKFKMTEPGIVEKELRRQGHLYIMTFVYSRGSVSRELLGYDMTKSESAYLSVTYSDGKQQLKNIPSNTPVFKFYFKHIDSGNVFLGTKWDADMTWQQALINHIVGMKTELRLN